MSITHAPLTQLFLVAVTILLPGRALAQHTHTLEEVVVTARPIGSRGMAHIPQPVDVLTGEELREKLASSLGETLAREPGVSASDFGQGASRPVIRGLGGARVRMLENGIGSLDASTVSADHAVGIEPIHAEQIEILRGPATLLYGSDAFAGLVNVVNGRLPVNDTAPTRFQGDVRYNSALGERTVAVRADGRLDETLGVHFDALRRAADDYESGAGKVSNSHLSTDDLSLGMGWNGKQGYAAMSFGRFASTYGIPTISPSAGIRPFINLDQDRVDIEGRIDAPMPGLESASLRIGYVDYEHTEFELPAQPGTRVTNDEWEGRTEFRHESVGRWHGVFGLHHRNRNFGAEGDEAYIPATKSNSTGVFLLEESDWGDWHIELGGRYEHVSTDPSDLSGRERKQQDLVSISFGTLWEFAPDYGLGISVTRAQRAPATEELFANGPHLGTGTFEIGSPQLHEETAHNADLSLRKNAGYLTWNLNLFVNGISDFIFQEFTDLNGDGSPDFVDEAGSAGGELLRVQYRQTGALLYGIEAEARLEIFNDGLGHLDAQLWGDWVRAQFRSGGNLPRISPARIGASLDWSWNAWHADLVLINVFRQGKTAALESMTGGYVLLDLGLRRDLDWLGPETNVFLRGTNLLDETARRHTSFLKDRAPLPGRAIAVGISLSY